MFVPYTSFNNLLLYRFTVNNLIQLTLLKEVFGEDMLLSLVGNYTNITEIEPPLIKDTINHSNLSILNALFKASGLTIILEDTTDKSAQLFIENLESLNILNTKILVNKKYQMDFGDVDYIEFNKYLNE